MSKDAIQWIKENTLGYPNTQKEYANYLESYHQSRVYSITNKEAIKNQFIEIEQSFKTLDSSGESIDCTNIYTILELWRDNFNKLLKQ